MIDSRYRRLVCSNIFEVAGVQPEVDSRCLCMDKCVRQEEGKKKLASLGLRVWRGVCDWEFQCLFIYLFWGWRERGGGRVESGGWFVLLLWCDVLCFPNSFMLF